MKLFASLLLLMWASGPVSPELRYFRYVRALEQMPTESRQTCAVLDPAIFAHAASGLADLRLYRDATETPYAVQMNEPAGPYSQQVAVLNLGETKGHTSFDAAMPAGPFGDVELAIEGHDFLATVTVTGKQTQIGELKTKLGAYTIFDLTQQKLGRSTVLHLPASDFRYLNFEIDGAIRPESVKGLTVASAAGEAKYVAVLQSSAMRQQGRQTLIEMRLPAHTPVDRLHFTPGAEPANFSRNVEIRVTPVIAAKAGAEEITRVRTESGDLLRVHRMEGGRSIDEEHLNLTAPRGLFEEASLWTITIENGDDKPVDLKSVELQMVRRELCFDAATNATYKLHYGDEALSAPRYDYASLFKLQSDAAQAHFGPEEQNPMFEARPDSRPFTERHPILLWAALGAVVLLLGVITVRTARSTTANGSS